MRLRDDTARLAVPVGGRDHAEGPPEAPAALVEYGDFECPACGSAYPMVKELHAEEGDRLRVVFRHFPLNSIHPHARAAACAAEAAGLQGRFWEMHDMLFENQDALEDEDLLGYAGKLGLDIARFDADRQSEEVAERVSDDFRGGVRSGVNGTPTFFVNGLRHDGPSDSDSLRAEIEQAAAAQIGGA